jgi:hypothetical protein
MAKRVPTEIGGLSFREGDSVAFPLPFPLLPRPGRQRAGEGAGDRESCCQAVELSSCPS